MICLELQHWWQTFACTGLELRLLQLDCSCISDTAIDTEHAENQDFSVLRSIQVGRAQGYL
jgi:hypothetical protein